VDPATVRAAIEQQNARMIDALQKADTATIGSLYADDAVVMMAGQPAWNGKAEMMRNGSAMLNAVSFSDMKLTTQTVDVAGDYAIETGTIQMTITPKGGKPVPDKGKYVTVWKKEGNAWKVSQDIFNSDAAVAAPPAQHALLSPADVKWGDPPPVLPKGARFAVVSGDPSQPVPFVVRLQMPAGYRIAPHWHPTIENVTVLNGAFALGMGEQFDEAKMTALPVGGYATLPAEMRHYAMAKSAATVQVHGTGPFVINYVNPADDPSKK
jgi:uncharacterized protein (TIGR02246 family)